MTKISSAPARSDLAPREAKSPESDGERKQTPSTVSPATVTSQGSPLSLLVAAEKASPCSVAHMASKNIRDDGDDDEDDEDDDSSWTPAHVRLPIEWINHQ